MEHPGDASGPPNQSEPRSLQINTPKIKAPDVLKSEGTSVKAPPGTPPEADAATKKDEDMKSLKSHLDPDTSGGAVSQRSVDPDRHHGGPPEENTRKSKRPAPLPLPALALFLKQHLAKSKKANGKLDCPSSAVPPRASASPSPNGVDSPSDAPQAAEAVPPCDSAVQAALHPEEALQKGPESDAVPWPSSPSCPEAGANKSPKASRTCVLSSTSFAERTCPEAGGPDAVPLLACSPVKSIPLSPCSLVSLPVDLSPAPVPSSTKSSSLLPDSPAMMPLLPDPECSSFCFESFSPASSPEPLVSLACSQVVQLGSITFDPKQAEEKSGGNSSVFKWHTVLPAQEPYMDTSFSFQPSPQTLLPAPPPEAPAFASSSPPPVALPFQESEHSLPFPAGLSPLQLPLSPTFSSLDGDGLSPTPSLTDLVHFFSNDDLGMGLDFSSSEPVPVPCQSPGAEDQRSQQEPANKRYKHKKCRRHKGVKSSVEVRTTYVSMQPNLEEVEEQLFVSFTSKVLVPSLLLTLSPGPGPGLSSNLLVTFSGGPPAPPGRREAPRAQHSPGRAAQQPQP